ncbi:MAG: M1 family metallopeptidase [Syntrophobacteraceae bacterium]
MHRAAERFWRCYRDLPDEVRELHSSVTSSAFIAILSAFLLLFGIRGKVLCMAAALIFISLGFGAAWGAEVCHHDLKIELQPGAHRLLVQDDIRVDEWKGGEIVLLLSDKAKIKSVLVNGKPSRYSFRSGKLTLSAISPAEGSVDASSPRSLLVRSMSRLRVTISFDAVFNDPVAEEPATFDNPGFGVAGSIGDRGTFLLADSGWYPSFAGWRAATAELPACKIAAGEIAEDFNLEVTAPRGIYAVTAGELIGHEDRGAISISSWKTGPIGQGLSLSAGRYIVRGVSPRTGSALKPSASPPVYTYFTSENDSLSETYLKAAASHIEFYERLFGPYPFPKFAIVENFFPTGYGFPSYTLLGASVLKLPFIPQTSLRHEIAHSWWGNGVLVDYASGNWCEGLTTYVADYLSQEIPSAAEGNGQSGWRSHRPAAEGLSGEYGRGASPPHHPDSSLAPRSSEIAGMAGSPPPPKVAALRNGDPGRSAALLYRQQILQEYATFVASGADFALRSFESRSSPATKAVGYGKAAFVFHMIRQKLGDEAFWNSLRQIYKERLFVRTSWEDFRDVFVRTGGWDPAEAKVFFDQWVARSGAPVLRLRDVQLKSDASGWQATASVDQDHPWYDLDIEVALKISPNERLDKTIGIKGGSTSFAIGSSAEPQRLIVDPDVNIFRLLSPEEIPSTVNSVKGSKSLTAVLRDGSPPEAVKAFRLLLEGLGHAEARITNEKEAEMKTSKGGDFLFFGLPRSEKLKSRFSSSPEDVTLSSEKFSVKGFSGGDCLFLVLSESNRGAGSTALFLPVSGTSADPVLTAARKITHYGKYSYLAFSHGVIQQKGVWEVFRSPLQFDFTKK